MESLYKVKYARHIITSLSKVHVFVDFGITVVTNIKLIEDNTFISDSNTIGLVYIKIILL
mgnify:CR=1 FL=1